VAADASVEDALEAGRWRADGKPAPRFIAGGTNLST
jgi:hypothetical protein